MGQYVNRADLNAFWAKVKADFTHSLAIDGTDLKLTRELHTGDNLDPTTPPTIYNLGTISRSTGRTWLGLGTAAYVDIVSTFDSTGTSAVNGQAVAQALNSLPTPMQFKGTVGTNGTKTWATLPSAASSEGHVYKVITKHATAVSSPSGNPKNQGWYELNSVTDRYEPTNDTTVVSGKTYYTDAANVGDTIVSNGTTWVIIPSGDEPSGTVTNIATGIGLLGGPITTTGTIKVALADETPLGSSATVATETSGRNYGIVVDDEGKLAVTVPWTNTKNTAGSTNTTDKIFLIGAKSQGANPQTYSNVNIYIGDDGHLYSNAKQVVNLSDTQALTNKTYNGLTLTKASTGFTIAGGTTSRTLTVNKDITLDTAASHAHEEYVVTLGTSGNNLTWVQGTGTAATITIPYATKALKDNVGNQIDTTYLKLSGGDMTGSLMLQNDVKIGWYKAGNTNKYNNIISVNASDNLVIGYSTASTEGESTNIFGNIITLNTGTNERLRVTADGKVGIGTNSPSDTLSVTGTASVSGISTFGNNVRIANNNALQFANSSSSYKNVLTLDSNNKLILGGETSQAGYDTYMDGNTIIMRIGATPTAEATLSSTGLAVTHDITSTIGNIQAVAGGVAAYGIADLAMGQGGGSGTVTSIKFGTATKIDSVDGLLEVPITQSGGNLLIGGAALPVVTVGTNNNNNGLMSYTDKTRLNHLFLDVSGLSTDNESFSLSVLNMNENEDTVITVGRIGTSYINALT